MLSTEISAPKKNFAPGTGERRCRRPGCENKLSAANVVGLCARHVRWTAPSNGHAAAPGIGEKANGKINGNGHAEFLEDRLDRLILGFPVTEKAKIATLWLSGKL